MNRSVQMRRTLDLPAYFTLIDSQLGQRMLAL
jgi:hypothetical protein